MDQGLSSSCESASHKWNGRGDLRAESDSASHELRRWCGRASAFRDREDEEESRPTVNRRGAQQDMRWSPLTHHCARGLMPSFKEMCRWTNKKLNVSSGPSNGRMSPGSRWTGSCSTRQGKAMNWNVAVGDLLDGSEPRRFGAHGGLPVHGNGLACLPNIVTRCDDRCARSSAKLTRGRVQIVHVTQRGQSARGAP